MSRALPHVEKAVGILVTMANTCKHERAERVDGGAKWCIDCGAYMPKRGPVNVRHPSWVTLMHLAFALDDGT